MPGVLTFLLMTDSVVAASATQQSESNKGVTVDGLARGLRSAAQNIEKEIPKIGPAIGKTFKSIGGNSSEQKSSQHQPSSKR